MMPVFWQHSREKTTPWDWLRRLLLLFLAAGVFGAGVLLVLFLGPRMSVKQMRVLREVEARAAEMEKSVEVEVLRAGFEEKNAGGQILFVPAVVIRVRNLSGREVQVIDCQALFSMREGTICRGNVGIAALGPGEDRDVVLKCVDVTAFGSVIHGIKRHQLGKTVEYQVRLRAEGVDFGRRRGVLDPPSPLEIIAESGKPAERKAEN